MPSEWRSPLIPIYKNNRDIKDTTNYHEIKRVSHTREKQI